MCQDARPYRRAELAGIAPSRQTGPVQKITLTLGDGGQLVAYESGSATDGRPTVALLHGIGMTHLTWARVQPLLAPTHHVVSFDLPGFGVSRDPSRTYSVEQFAAAVAEGLDRLGVDRHVVVGHSMGVQFAIETARQRPEVTDGLVLIGPVVDPLRRTVGMQARDLALDTLREPPRVNARVFIDYLRGGVGWYLVALRAMMAYPTDERVGSVRCPVVVLRGTLDSVARHDWALSLAASAAGQARLVTVPNVAHVLPLTAPDAVVSAVHTLGEFARTEPSAPDTAS